jgi:hypothetical protein
MKNILLKLANGENEFNCQWNGKPNKCEILMLDIRSKRAFVRFEKPIETTCSEYEPLPFANGPDEVHLVEKKSESYEEWISLPDN